MIAPPGLIDAVLKTASDAIIATDRAGTINFWNPGADRIFGFTADEGKSADTGHEHPLAYRFTRARPFSAR